MTRHILLGPAVLLILSAGMPASAGQQPTKVSEYLRRTLNASGSVRFTAANVDLNGDGREEVVVYVTDPAFCGSGGCNTLVLEPEGPTYRVLMNATITRPPIRVLPTRSHAWRDLGVMVSGGAIERPYEARMRFDGRRYPSNPTVPPAIPMKRDAGRVLISRTTAQ